MTTARALVVLVVEDNDNNRYLTNFLLVREGFRVVHARSGGEALEVALRERPDLVLMDIQLPEMDGYQVTARLRAHPQLARIPVVGVSSYATAADRERARAAGFAGYIEKPIDPDTFAAEVARLLAQARPRLRLLSVDDDPHNRYLLEQQLGSAGWEVVSVADGREALARLEQEPFDAILSDILMPRMDGFQLCRELQRRDGLRQIPFVFYTATYTDPQDAELGLAMGAVRFVPKPAEPELLDSIIRAAMETAREAPPESRAQGPAEEEEVLLEAYNRRLVEKLDRKVAQLEAVSRDLREVFDHVSDALLVFSRGPAGFVLESLNPAAERATGLSRERVSGQAPVEALGEELGSTIERGLSACRPGQPPVRLELELAPRRQAEGAGPDGPRTFELLLSPVGDARGPVTRVTAFARDVTERAALEARLLHARKMESVGRIAGGVAHDFNNLLTAILGFSDLALAALPPGPVRGHVEEVWKAGMRASELTRQLLVFSRHEPPRREVVDLNGVVSDMRRLLGRVLGTDVRLVVQLEPTPAHVELDPGQLEQAILNLCLNARDAMPQGGTLTLETARVQPDPLPGGPQQLMLAVTDTGCGMPPEVLSRVFEPFFTTKPPGRGTGLGLSTVFGIVQAAGGKVEVNSVPGQGSSFRLFLPAASPGAARELATSLALPAGGPETILLAEDDPLVRDLAEDVLRQGGYQVLSAGRGDEALALSDQHGGTIDLLVSDLIMPDMSGRDLAERLVARRPGLRVILASGYADGDVLQRAASELRGALLPKPFTPAALLRAVRDALDAAEERR